MSDREGRSRDPHRAEAIRRSGLVAVGDPLQLELLTDIAVTVTGAPVAMISVVDDSHAYVVASTGLDSDWAIERTATLSHSTCASVIASGEPLVLDSMARDPRFGELTDQRPVESYCGVPIRGSQGQVMGSLCVVDSSDREWGPETIRLLKRIAEIVTNAVDTSIAFTNELLDLQRRSLPPSLPPAPNGSFEARYRPVPFGDAIGGDFYDGVACVDGSIAIVIGDVAGRGLGSTQAAAQLRAAARAILAQRPMGPTDVLAQLGVLTRSLSGCTNAAVLVATFSADGETVRWARAGAPPPIVVGADTVVAEGPVAPPLGVGTIDESFEVTTELADVHRLILFTDGLLNAQQESIDAGLRRIAERAAENATVDRLIDDCVPHQGQTDDVAVVTWQRGW
ncbi:MAG: GAF domain-containing SpoIIE family protein phosphatase [Actinomycetota bacterium]